jgi:hypothetical protein
MEEHESARDATVEEVSESLLDVTIAGRTFDVSVHRTYHTAEHFGEFRSLDQAILALKVLVDEERAREQEEKRIQEEQALEQGEKRTQDERDLP